MKWDYRQRKRARDSGRGGVLGLPPVVIAALKMGATFLAIFLCLRFALPGPVRLALAFAVLMAGAYWIWRGFAFGAK